MAHIVHTGSGRMRGVPEEGVLVFRGIGTFQTGEQPESPNGGVVTQIGAPPQPPLSVVVDLPSPTSTRSE
jgi:hypothetical protein